MLSRRDRDVTENIGREISRRHYLGAVFRVFYLLRTDRAGHAATRKIAGFSQSPIFSWAGNSHLLGYFQPLQISFRCRNSLEIQCPEMRDRSGIQGPRVWVFLILLLVFLYWFLVSVFQAICAVSVRFFMSQWVSFRVIMYVFW